jgi:hypothetical protein
VERFRALMQSDFKWAALILAGVGLIFGVAVLIGLALTALSAPVAAAVAFILIALVGAVVVFELPQLWARLPR